MFGVWCFECVDEEQAGGVGCYEGALPRREHNDVPQFRAELFCVGAMEARYAR